MQKKTEIISDTVQLFHHNKKLPRVSMIDAATYAENKLTDTLLNRPSNTPIEKFISDTIIELKQLAEIFKTQLRPQPVQRVDENNTMTKNRAQDPVSVTRVQVSTPQITERTYTPRVDGTQNHHRYHANAIVDPKTGTTMEY